MRSAGLIARRALVSGRVQGVNFRAATAAHAQALGVRGHARNLDDGRVEILAIGGCDAVEALLAWLWRGPAFAQVAAVEVETVTPPPDTPHGFTRL